MATPIARVTAELSAQRGPDVVHRIRVPKEWLARGTRISLRLPPVLTCARCEGGGCDGCERRGALRLRAATAAEETVSVRLGESSPDQTQLIRLPECGAPASDPSWPAGCLLLQVEVGTLSNGVNLEEPLLAAGPGPVWSFSKIWLLLAPLTAAVWWLLRTFAD